MHLFFVPDIQSSKYMLSEEESKHAIRVLRLKAGDTIYLIDGVGGLYFARIIDDHPKRCFVEVYQTEKEYGKRNYGLSIAIAPTKNIDRFEWFLEKATEIGIDRIIPFISQQSERKVIKPERLNKVINAAIKQSKQAYRPILEELISFNRLIKLNYKGQKFITHCFENEKTFLQENLVKNNDCLILIGPEGDFTEKEIQFAMQNGFTEVSLGDSRLRTETAGIVAVHTVALINHFK